MILSKTREEKGITQVELSRLSNINQVDISKIERGLGNPTVAKVNKLFKALGKEIEVSLKTYDGFKEGER